MAKTTKCTVCGTKLQYKTKPPKKCKKCKVASKRKPKGSKEQYMFKVIDNLLPLQYYIRNGYYSFLISPRGAPMQLDLYYPDLKLAFEYDGQQHSKYNKYFHKTKKAFEYLKLCDKIKNKICRDLGITLIRINYKDKINYKLIQGALEESGRHDIINGGVFNDTRM